MKTKNIIQRAVVALIATFTLALAGCRTDGPQTKPATEGKKFKFEVNVGDKPGDGADTRAVKSGWATGDRILVYFGGSETNRLWLEYDTEGKWIETSSEVSTLDPAGGTAQALYTSNFKRGDSAIEPLADILFTDEGEYVVTGDIVAVTLTMDRRITSRVTVEGLTSPHEWLLAGPDLSVVARPDIEAGAFDAAGGAWAATLSAMFTPSDIAGRALAPAVFLPWETEGAPSFFVMDNSATTGTTFLLYNAASDRTWTRTYFDSELAPGKAVVIQGPEGEQSGQWAEILKPIRSVALTVTAPVACAEISNAYVTSATDPLLGAEGVKYTVTSMSWMVGEEIADGTTFDYGTIYHPHFYLKAKPGYKFDTGNTADFTINGISATEDMGHLGFGADNTELSFTVDFPATDRLVGVMTFSGAIPASGATIPAGYSSSSSTGIASCEFLWSGGTAGETKFAYNTLYTLTIEMKAKAGYTFTGSYGDDASVEGFTVNGNKPGWVCNDGQALKISYTFEVTDPVPGNDVGFDPSLENRW